MTSILTGDIIKSQQTEPTVWLPTLKKALKKIQPHKTSREIFRGDSFQIEAQDIRSSFINAVYIKTCIKTIKNLDIRLAIGIGGKSFSGDMVSESSGEAFMYSGTTLETLKKSKQNLKIKTSNQTLNEELNLYFRLALIAMDDWTTNSAEIVKLSIENPDARQEDLAQLVNISQDAVSKRLKRAHLDDILELDTIFRKKIDILLK
jgi:hypothetical protein